MVQCQIPSFQNAPEFPDTLLNEDLAVDFISGMTDSYAVNLYEELTGIKLPR